MVGTIALRWIDRGVLMERGRTVAGPGEVIYVDSVTAERYVSERKAEYVVRGSRKRER